MNRALASLRSAFRSRDEIYRDALEGHQFNAVYFLMLVFACLIALLGLLLNSPAVVIGAMLISPLMGPILSCALALSLADLELGRKATRNLGLSVVETVLIAAAATLLSPLKDLTPEIAARTNPNLMDLLVALFSGLAGTLAFCSRSGGFTILPGVAIATAIMPPLATVGYGICTAQWSVASGAFMLFFTNLTAIVISADVVFFLVGFRPPRHADQGTYARYRTAGAATLMLLLSIPLVRTLGRAAEQAWVRKLAGATLRERLGPAEARRLAGLTVRLAGDRVSVDAVVYTARFIDAAEVRALQDALVARTSRNVQLDLQQIQSARPDLVPEEQSRKGQDFVAGSDAAHAREVEAAPGVALAKARRTAEAALSFLISSSLEMPLAVESVTGEQDGSMLIAFSCRRPEPSEPEFWTLMATALSLELRAPVHLKGNVLSGGSATIGFRPGSSRAAPEEVEKAKGAVERWKERADVDLLLVPHGSTQGDLSKRRIEYVRASLKARLAMSTLEAEEPQEPDAVRIFFVQRVDSITARQREAPGASPMPASKSPSP